MATILSSFLSAPLSVMPLVALRRGIDNHHGLLRKSFEIAYYKRCRKDAAYIGHTASIYWENICFPHGISGIFISGEATIGKNCVIYQQVTIGSNTLADSAKQGAPTIGDNCLIGAGAKVIGRVTIGNNCRIGAGVTVARDIPDDTLVVSAAPRLFHKDGMDNRYRSKNSKGEWVYR